MISDILQSINGVVEREQAAIGAFTILQEPTRPMKEKAVIQEDYLRAGLGYEDNYLVILHYFDESGEWKVELAEK